MYALWAEQALPVERTLADAMIPATPHRRGATAARQVRAIARLSCPPRPGQTAGTTTTAQKLGSDPLYPGVCDALRGTRRALLDMGCGLGLLAHALRAQGLTCLPRRGQRCRQDRPARGARVAAAWRTSTSPRSTWRASYPAHRGSVALLDVLQFIPPDAQARALDAAIAMLVRGAKLVIRTGLADGSKPRARDPRRRCVLARAGLDECRGRRAIPTPMTCARGFAAAGLQVEFTPLYGSTPFNNWRVVATSNVSRLRPGNPKFAAQIRAPPAFHPRFAPAARIAP
jgi:hypothetical protein